jgi:hypothetical protein
VEVGTVVAEIVNVDEALEAGVDVVVVEVVDGVDRTRTIVDLALELAETVISRVLGTGGGGEVALLGTGLDSYHKREGN